MFAISYVLIVNVISTMAARGSETGTEIPSVSEYFPNLGGDMTKLTWAHAVNSRALLKKSIEDEAVMMLEADVVLGTVVGGNGDVIPIMAHPPARESDLSLRQFVDEVIQAQKSFRKGMKLDFKSTDAFVESVEILNAVRDRLAFPIWLNADILRGPIESQTVPVDADKFLSLSAEKFPATTLSLGWTTRYGPNITGQYTDAQLDEMKTAITGKRVLQPVTLAVRAGIVAETSVGIRNLVQNIDTFQKSNKTTLTIWMSTDTDPVDIGNLRKLILTLGKSRIFLDVPESIRSQLNLSNSGGSTPVSGAVGAVVAVLTSVSALITNAFSLFD